MYFEDFTVGQKFSLEPVTITEEEISKFAGKYDPLPIHTEPEFARDSIYGGIIASGFHTLCAVYAQLVKIEILSTEVIGGLGIDFLQWTAPVRPNDSLKADVEIMEKIPSSKEGRGIIGFKITAWNQKDQVVLVVQIKAMIKSRE